MKKRILFLCCALLALLGYAAPLQPTSSTVNARASRAALKSGGTPVAPHGVPAINLVKVGNTSTASTTGRYESSAPATLPSAAKSSAKGKMNPCKTAPSLPARVGASGSTVYGWLTSYTDPAGQYPLVGLNELQLDGTYSNMFNRNDGISTGYLRNGRICAFSIDAWYGNIMGAYYREFALDSSEPLTTVDIEIYDDYYNADLSNIFVCAAYNPTDDMIYGYSYNAEGSGYLFSKASANDPTNLTEVKALTNDTYGETCRSMTYNPSTGKIVGITIDRKFVEIDCTTGSQTELMSLGAINSLGEASGLVYSPVDGFYLWQTRDINQEGWLFKINPEENSFEQLAQMPSQELFAFLVTPDAGVNPHSPQAPLILSNTFQGTPDTYGSITVTAPASAMDGSPLTGTLEILVNVDGAVRPSRSAAPGQDVVFDFDNLTEGMHSFMFSAKSDNLTGETARLSLWIGNDDPKAPAELWMEADGIHWTPVTEGENGGYLDQRNLTYDIALDEEMLVTGVTGDFYPYDFGDEVKAHVAQIQAVCHDRRSYVTTSPKYVSGDGLELPVYIKPTEEDDAIMTYINSNGDAQIWNYLADNYGNSYFAYSYSTTEDADDWIVIPAINFPDAESLYTLSFDTWSDAMYGELLEVKMGPLPTISAMTTTLLPRTTILWDDPVTFNETFTIPAAGQYYIGFHCVSKANSNWLRLNNIRVVQSTASKDGPVEPGNIIAVETAPGELRAKVVCDLPRQLFSGEAIPAGTLLTVTATSEAGSDSASGMPGERVEMELPTVQGDNRIAVQAAIGDKLGLIDYCDIFTGVDEPGRVRNLRASVSPDNMTIHLTWDAPEIGANGGYVAPTGNTYMLMGMVPSDMGMRWGVLAEIGDDVFEYDYVVEPGTMQAQYDLGVNVMNASGVATSFARTQAAAGVPYELPMTDDFSDFRQHYNPILRLEPSEEYLDASWSVGAPGVLDPKYETPSGAVLFGSSFSDFDNSRARCSLPRFSTLGATNVEFTVTFAGDADMEVFANYPGLDAPISMGKASELPHDASAVYNTYTFTLPAEVLNRPATEILIDAICNGPGHYCVIDSYDIRNNVSFDFGLSDMQAPVSAPVGSVINFSVAVTNYGNSLHDLPGLKWRLTRGEETLWESENTEWDELQPGQSMRLTGELEIQADWMGDCALALVVTDQDANSANNVASAPVRVCNGHGLAVTDLRGMVKEGKVELSWTLPVDGSDVASFEDETPFESNPAMIQGFTNIDGDKCDVAGFAQWECPNMFDPAAFTVWSASEINAIVGTDGIYSASDGDRFLIAFCPSIDASRQPDADDWLISPEVKGATEVLIDVRPILYMYGAETFEFMVSDSPDPESFRVLETVAIAGPADRETFWNTYAFTLPADARYFAVHYVSNDKFGIQIDNIRYISAQNEARVADFDIYRNDVMIEENITAPGTYIDAAVPATGVHAYHLVPVKDGLRGVRSNVARVDMSSGIDAVQSDAAYVSVSARPGFVEISVPESMAATGSVPVQVYSADGKVCASFAMRGDRSMVNVPAGAYIVRCGSAVVKVLVP